VGEYFVDKRLSEQAQETLDVLAIAQTKAREVSQAMKKRRVSFGLEYGHIEDDITHIIGKMRYLKQLAERREKIEAQAALDAATDPGMEAV
jgi:hypothetical protein